MTTLFIWSNVATLKYVLFKNVLGKTASSKNSQKLPHLNECNQRGSFCEFFGDAIFPSKFLNKTDFKAGPFNKTPSKTPFKAPLPLIL